MSEKVRPPGHFQYMASLFLFPVAILCSREWDFLLGRLASHLIQAAGDVALIVGWLMLYFAYQKVRDQGAAKLQ